jgi:hypothetical protein
MKAIAWTINKQVESMCALELDLRTKDALTHRELCVYSTLKKAQWLVRRRKHMQGACAEISLSSTSSEPHAPNALRAACEPAAGGGFAKVEMGPVGKGERAAAEKEALVMRVGYPASMRLQVANCRFKRRCLMCA